MFADDNIFGRIYGTKSEILGTLSGNLLRNAKDYYIPHYLPKEGDEDFLSYIQKFYEGPRFNRIDVTSVPLNYTKVDETEDIYYVEFNIFYNNARTFKIVEWLKYLTSKNNVVVECYDCNFSNKDQAQIHYIIHKGNVAEALENNSIVFFLDTYSEYPTEDSDWGSMGTMLETIEYNERDSYYRMMSKYASDYIISESEVDSYVKTVEDSFHLTPGTVRDMHRKAYSVDAEFFIVGGFDEYNFNNKTCSELLSNSVKNVNTQITSEF